jgi:hypothetical protein
MSRAAAGASQVPKASRRCGASALATRLGSPMISGSSEAVDRRARRDAFVARRRLGLAQALARAHQQDGGDDREAQDSERQRQRGELVPIELQKRRDVGVERGTRRRRGGVVGARRRSRNADRGGDDGCGEAECSASRMSRQAPAGDPDRVRHARLPLCRISTGG